MLFESHASTEINIKSLTLPPLSASPYTPQALYNDLKGSKGYDKRRKQWGNALTPAQRLSGENRNSHDQLLGILVEAFIDRARAQEFYNQLKSSAFYDEGRKLWNSSIYPNQMRYDARALSFCELAGVLVETEFNPTRGKVLFQRLKDSILYNDRKKLWQYGLTGNSTSLEKDKKAHLLEAPHHTADQLMGILVEAKFNKSHASELYESLRAGSFYDQKSNLWYDTRWDGPYAAYTTMTYNQLLGILIEAELNTGRAAIRYDNLKAGPLHDPTRQQWISGMIEYDDGEPVYFEERLIRDQMLGILVEFKLGLPTAINLGPEALELPEIRRF